MVASWHLYYKDDQLSSREKNRLNQALRLASKSKCRQQHGAILVDGGRVLGHGVNISKNDPVYSGEAQLAYSIHAEESAIRNWNGDVGTLKNATLYVARLGKNGSPAMSKPCGKCQKLLKDSGVKTVIYTISNRMEI